MGTDRCEVECGATCGSLDFTSSRAIRQRDLGSATKRSAFQYNQRGRPERLGTELRLAMLEGDESTIEDVADQAFGLMDERELGRWVTSTLGLRPALAGVRALPELLCYRYLNDVLPRCVRRTPISRLEGRRERSEPRRRWPAGLCRVCGWCSRGRLSRGIGDLAWSTSGEQRWVSFGER